MFVSTDSDVVFHILPLKTFTTQSWGDMDTLMSTSDGKVGVGDILTAVSSRTAASVMNKSKKKISSDLFSRNISISRWRQVIKVKTAEVIVEEKPKN